MGVVNVGVVFVPQSYSEKLAAMDPFLQNTISIIKYTARNITSI